MTFYWKSLYISSSKHSLCSYTFCCALAAFNLLTFLVIPLLCAWPWTPIVSLHFLPPIVPGIWYVVLFWTEPVMQFLWRQLQQQLPVRVLLSRVLAWTYVTLELLRGWTEDLVWWDLRLLSDAADLKIPYIPPFSLVFQTLDLYQFLNEDIL